MRVKEIFSCKWKKLFLHGSLLFELTGINIKAIWERSCAGSARDFEMTQLVLNQVKLKDAQPGFSRVNSFHRSSFLQSKERGWTGEMATCLERSLSRPGLTLGLAVINGLRPFFVDARPCPKAFLRVLLTFLNSNLMRCRFKSLERIRNNAVSLLEQAQTRVQRNGKTNIFRMYVLVFAG